MDLDDPMDDLIQAPTRTKFPPKGSKFKPKPKLKTEPSEPLQSSTLSSSQSLPKKEEPFELSSLPLSPKKEELDTKPDLKPQCRSDNIDMDIDEKPGEISTNVSKEVEEEEEQTDEMMENEPEDEVVREIDVYFSPSIDPSTQLYVLQYPLRPTWRSYDLDERCEEVRVKVPSAEVEVDLSIDVDTKNYEIRTDPRLQIRKQTLTTTWKPPHTSRYTVGVLTGNKLHLNPVHAVVQLRPSIKYLDSKESKRKTIKTTNVDDIVKIEAPEEGIRSGASKKSKITEQNKDNEEDWVPLKYHGTSSDMSTSYLQKMMPQESPPINFPLTSCDYLRSLCPSTSIRYESLLIRGFPTLPLKERFSNQLLKGPQLYRFDTLKHLAPDKSDEEVLEILQEYGRLIQGLWVPKSSLVYGTNKKDEVFARDYVLLLFSKNFIVSSSQLPQQSSELRRRIDKLIPKLVKDMKGVLNVLSNKRIIDDWKLKMDPDISFTKKYPSIVKKQEKDWEITEKKINDFFSVQSEPGSSTVAIRTSNVETSVSAMSEEVRGAITKTLHVFFKKVKVCRFQQISQRLRDMAASEPASSMGFAIEAVSAANSIDANPDELQAIISQVAVNIHGLCVPKSSPDRPQYDSVRKVVIDLFVAAQGPNAKLTKAPIYAAAKMKLKRDITLTEYQQVMQELCVFEDRAWILRSGN